MNSPLFALGSSSLLAYRTYSWVLQSIVFGFFVLLCFKFYFSAKFMGAAPYLASPKGFNGLPKDFDQYIENGYRGVNFLLNVLHT